MWLKCNVIRGPLESRDGNLRPVSDQGDDVGVLAQHAVQGCGAVVRVAHISKDTQPQGVGAHGRGGGEVVRLAGCAVGAVHLHQSFPVSGYQVGTWTTDSIVISLRFDALISVEQQASQYHGSLDEEWGMNEKKSAVLCVMLLSELHMMSFAGTIHSFSSTYLSC